MQSKKKGNHGNTSWAQDTLSRMTLYGYRDSYKESIDKEFIKLNKIYRTGIKHGIYYIYDLGDTDNKLTSEHDTLLFLNEHIYHVVSPRVSGRVSMIIIPSNDIVAAFIGLNCCKKRHSVEDVIYWVKDRFQNVSDSMIEGIRNYQAFQPNTLIDPQEGSTPKCERRCIRPPSHTRYHYKKPKIIHRKNLLEFKNSKGSYFVTIPQKHTKISIYETEPEYSTMEYVVEDTITFAKFAITHTFIPLPMFKIVPETGAYFFAAKKNVDTLKYAGKIHEYNKGNITRKRVTYWKLYTIVDYRNVQPENINTGFNGNIISVGYWNVRRIQKRKYDRMISTITFVEKQK
ncbi:MAG: hypothetical protein J6Y35_05115 [Bacteroidales bacterium]|nr:hypothetical protein [Bacteroidales bacterium]